MKNIHKQILDVLEGKTRVKYETIYKHFEELHHERNIKIQLKEMCKIGLTKKEFSKNKSKFYSRVER